MMASLQRCKRPAVAAVGRGAAAAFAAFADKGFLLILPPVRIAEEPEIWGQLRVLGNTEAIELTQHGEFAPVSGHLFATLLQEFLFPIAEFLRGLDVADPRRIHAH